MFLRKKPRTGKGEPSDVGSGNFSETFQAGMMQLKRHSTTDEHRWTRMKSLFPSALFEEPTRRRQPVRVRPNLR